MPCDGRDFLRRVDSLSSIQCSFSLSSKRLRYCCKSEKGIDRPQKFLFSRTLIHKPHRRSNPVFLYGTRTDGESISSCAVTQSIVGVKSAHQSSRQEYAGFQP